MSLGLSPVMDTLVLSAGGGFQSTYREPKGFPNGTTLKITIYDDAGATLATFLGNQVESTDFVFNETAASLVGIPHGANFVFSIQYPATEPVNVSYGTVVRKEPRFPLSLTVDPDNIAATYTASFAGNYIGPKWVPMGGSTSLVLHTLINQPPTLGPNYAFFNGTAARWLFPLNSDSVTVNISAQNHGAGQFVIVVCSDSNLNSWMGIEFETGISNNRVWIAQGTGSQSWNRIGSAVNNTVVGGDTYAVKYNNLSQTLALYKNTSLAPVISYQDTTGLFHHGEGFRYVGLAWKSSLFTPGVEPSAWEAKDGI